MRVRTLIAIVGMAACLLGSPVEAQLAPHGQSEVVMGHVQLVVKDVDAHKKFWAQLGGTPVKNGQLELIQIPGAYVILKQGTPTGGSVGSAVNHIGFNVKKMTDWLPKWQAAGFKLETPRPAQAFITAPDDIRVEILEDEKIDAPIKFHHVHYFLTNPLDMQGWYAKMLGAVPGKRGNFDAGDIPGANLTFTKSDTPQVPTAGRSVDQIGFEVKNLEAFAKKLEAAGVKFDQPYKKMPNSKLATATFVDPFGSKIQLTENLQP